LALASGLLSFASRYSAYTLYWDNWVGKISSAVAAGIFGVIAISVFTEIFRPHYIVSVAFCVGAISLFNQGVFD
jgi:hypothetical protein